MIVHLIFAKLNLFAMTTCCLALCLPKLVSPCVADEDYEVPQFSRSFDPDTIPADLFDTPCLPKRRQLMEKTTVTLPVAPESIPIHSGSSLDGSDTLSRSEKKRLAKAKRAAEARANAALAHAAKTKKKGKNL